MPSALDRLETAPRALLFGFRVGFASALLYGLAGLLVSCGLEADSFLASGAVEWTGWGGLLAAFLDQLILALTFSLLLGIPHALLQAACVFCLYGLAEVYRWGLGNRRALSPPAGALAGAAVAGAVAGLAHLLASAPGSVLHPVFFSSLTAYLVRLGAPSLIFFCTMAWAGWNVWGGGRSASGIVGLSPV